MAKAIAVTQAIKSLTEAETRLNLSRTEDEAFFGEWQRELPAYTVAGELRSVLQILKHLGQIIQQPQN